jgi:hypothetical protein
MLTLNPGYLEAKGLRTPGQYRSIMVRQGEDKATWTLQL